MTKEDVVRYSIDWQPHIYKQLVKLKEKKGIPISSLIRIAVLDLIKKENY